MTEKAELVRAGEMDGESVLAGRDIYQSKGDEAREIAQVQARMMIALRMPIDFDVVRQRTIKECQRVQFAETAMYSLPRGGKRIEGLSINFAMMAFQYMRNRELRMYLEADTPHQRVIRVELVNLESNTSWTELAVCSKTVERKKLADGVVPLGTRTNSYGDLVYIVPADDGDFTVKMRAELAKRKRDVILQGLPRWLRDEAMEVIRETKRRAAEGNDGGTFEDKRRRLVDGFDRLGISAKQLGEYLGHPVSDMSPAELTDLVGVGQAIKEKETTWTDIMAGKSGEENGSKMKVKMQAAQDGK